MGRIVYNRNKLWEPELNRVYFHNKVLDFVCHQVNQHIYIFHLCEVTAISQLLDRHKNDSLKALMPLPFFCP